MFEMFILLLVFQVKHLVADYYLQFPYMYENKGNDSGWFSPLLHHSLVHGVITFLILLIVAPELAIALSLFDTVTHFYTDRWKATQKDDITTSKFWYNLGIDQMIHHSVGIAIVFVAISS